MIKESVKFENSTVFEGLTSLRALLAAENNPTNDRRVLKILYDEGKADKLAKELGWLRAISEKHGFSLEARDAEEIEALSLGTSHGGILALCSERSIPTLDSLDGLPADGFYAMIQGIEDPYNFGYALRSLYACGCRGIILPERNWMSAAGVVARASAGASELFEIYTAEATEAALFFKEHGYRIVCADKRTENMLPTTPLKNPQLLIVGGERRGISRALLDLADTVVCIPYGREFGASLSAASATTILAYEIFRQSYTEK